ncbi:MAG: cytochrome c oxidase assembly protein subunit 15 [Pelagibacterales bacterium]|jgi:cytochrome c oxidase assembly protein subunit 15|nr:cytochrome c oxidase assembly protein subunit 15 [Pelagibacterales bacterium]
MLLNNQKYYRLINLWLILTILLIVSMIIVGGLTRLTDSGLSITKWDLFSGILPPFSESKWIEYFNLYKEIPQFILINNDISIDDFKIIFYWEFYHRLLGRIIGLFFLLPLIYFTFKKIINKKDLIKLYLIFFLICFQGFVGWFMVQSGLINDISVSHYRLSLHLFIAFIILSILSWIYLNNINLTHKKFFNNFTENNIIKFFIFLLFIQIIFGAFVSGLDAGKIYQTWPLMNSTFFPNDVEIKKSLDLINFNDRSYVQFIHRIIAYLIFGIYLFFGFNILINKKKYLYKHFSIVMLILLVQIVLGISTLISGLNFYLASLHQISSIFLIISSLNLYYRSI